MGNLAEFLALTDNYYICDIFRQLPNSILSHPDILELKFS